MWRRAVASLALLFSCSLCVGGCISISTQTEGNPITDELLGKIKKRKTTKAQVLQLLGSPLKIDRTDITALAERALSRWEGEELMLKIDPSLFDDVYIYEQRFIDRFAFLTGIFNYVRSDERSDRLSVFFDKKGRVLGFGWTKGSEDL